MRLSDDSEDNEEDKDKVTSRVEVDSKLSSSRSIQFEHPENEAEKVIVLSRQATIVNAIEDLQLVDESIAVVVPDEVF